MSADRVVHLVPALETGGMEQLVSQLASRRVTGDTSVVCLGRPGELGQQLIDGGHHVTWLDHPRSPIQLAARLRRQIRQWGADVLHCHNLQAFTFGALATRWMRLKRLVLTKHGTRMPADDSWGERFRRWAARRTSLVGVSPEVQSLLARWSHVPVDHVAMVPNGLDLGRFETQHDREAIRNELGLTREAFVVTCVARLAPEKDHATLIAAFQQVVASIPTSHLLLVGEGPAEESARRLTADAGLNDHVTWLGNRHDVPRLLAGSDLKVLSSVTEGMPLTILEAMAAGVAVVATDVGGVEDIVADGRSGSLVPPRQPLRLAQSIVDLAHDPIRRQAMGSAGRARVEEKFRLEATLDAYERIYLGNDADRS